jgi:RNA polymerase sigma-70 factor, ECF subfamily
MPSSSDDPWIMLYIQLVKRAQEGNSEAFDWLVWYHERELYRYLVGLLGNYEDAYDYTQQTLIKAWENLPMLRDASRFKPWLYMIARNLVNDYWRRRRRRTSGQSWEHLEENDVRENLPGPEEFVIRVELAKLALADLPAKLRRCLLLYAEGFSRREIAELVGISEQSVLTYVCNARRLLREAYQRQEEECELALPYPQADL